MDMFISETSGHEIATGPFGSHLRVVSGNSSRSWWARASMAAFFVERTLRKRQHGSMEFVGGVQLVHDPSCLTC